MPYLGIPPNLPVISVSVTCSTSVFASLAADCAFKVAIIGYCEEKRITSPVASYLSQLQR